MASTTTIFFSMQVIVFLYFYNFALVILNAFRIDKGKEMFYFPSIPFFMIKK